MIRRHWLPWLLLALAAALLPWLFYDWGHHRHDGFVVSMLSQMGMMTVLALSYNMLLGQAGLFSLCHATFFGFGGYATVHFLNAAADGMLPVPMELMPLLAGLAGLVLAIVFGAMATKQRATAFAMITLGIGELVATAALMFHHFFGGEGGVTTNRMIDRSLFGLSYASGIQVYYLILGWTLIAAVLMRLQTMTPLGRMANACRDNFERAQFMGYDPRIVRFLQFSLAGFFAGIGGGLYAVTYEIVTFDAVASPLSANALLMAYIGGNTVFCRPSARRGADHAAAERRQPNVELLADLCRRAVHRHGDLCPRRARRVDPGARTDLSCRAAAAAVGAVSASAAAGDRRGRWLRRAGGADLVPDDRRGAGQASGSVRFAGRRHSATPWTIAAAMLLIGGALAAPRSPRLRACLGRA